MQDAIVLWVGDFPLDGDIFTDTPVVVTEEEVPADDELAPAPVDTTAPANITLIVLPQDAVALNYLMLSKAELSLALRSTGDEQQTDTQAVTLQFIMDQYNIPYPTKLPYGWKNLQMTLDLMRLNWKMHLFLLLCRHSKHCGSTLTIIKTLQN